MANSSEAGWMIAIRCGKFRAVTFVPRDGVDHSPYQEASPTKKAALDALENFMSACGGDIGSWNTPDGGLTPELEDALLDGWDEESVVEADHYPQTFDLLHTLS